MWVFRAKVATTVSAGDGGTAGAEEKQWNFHAGKEKEGGSFGPYHVSRGCVFLVLHTVKIVQKSMASISTAAEDWLHKGSQIRAFSFRVDDEEHIRHIRCARGWIAARSDDGLAQLQLYDKVVPVTFFEQGSLGLNFGADAEDAPGWISEIKPAGAASRLPLLPALWITHIEGLSVFTYMEAIERIMGSGRPLSLVFSVDKPNALSASIADSLHNTVQRLGETVLVGRLMEVVGTVPVQIDSDINSAKVAQMIAGEIFVCLECKMIWEASQVRVKNSVGWITVASSSQTYVTTIRYGLSTLESDSHGSLVGQIMMAVKSATVRADSSFESEKTGKIPFGEKLKVLDATVVDGATRVRCETGWVSVLSKTGDTMLIPASDLSKVLFRCVATSTVRATQFADSQKVGRILPDQVIEVLSVKNVGKNPDNFNMIASADGLNSFTSQRRLKFSHGWVSETSLKGDSLFELVQDVTESANLPPVEEDSDDEFSLDFSTDVNLNMQPEEFLFPGSEWEDGEVSDYDAETVDKAYVATLCCLINNSLANGNDFESTVPEQFTENGCALLRQALSLGHDHEITLERHMSDLLPRAMRAAADVRNELDLQLWLLNQHPVYGRVSFPPDSETEKPFETWVSHQQSELAEVQETMSRRPMFAGSLVVQVYFGTSLAPPGQWKHKEPPRLLVKLFALAGEEMIESTADSPVDLRSGTVQWQGEKLTMDFAEEPALVKLSIECEGKTLGETILNLSWVPAPEFNDEEIDIPCMWKDIKHVKLASSSAVAKLGQSLGTVSIGLQYTYRKFLPPTVAEILSSISDISLIPGEKISAESHKLFRFLLRSIFPYAQNEEGATEDDTAITWLLDTFGETWGVTELYRKLCEMRCVLSDFNFSLACLARVESMLEELVSLMKDTSCANFETDLFGQVIEFLDKVLVRSFCTYKQTFPAAGEMTEDVLEKVISIHSQCDEGSDKKMSESIQSWATNVVERITQGALHDDGFNTRAAISKQQNLGARELLCLCEAMKSDIEDDDLVYQWIFPAEVPVVELICQEYYQSLKNGVMLLLFNSDEEGCSNESTLKLFTKVRDLQETIETVAPTIRLQDIASFFSPILDAHLMTTQMQIMGWATQASETDDFERLSVVYGDGLDDEDGAARNHSSSADDIFRILSQNVAPLLDFWKPPHLANIFCVALRAYCDSLYGLCEQDLPETNAESESVAASEGALQSLFFTAKYGYNPLHVHSYAPATNCYTRVVSLPSCF